MNDIDVAISRISVCFVPLPVTRREQLALSAIALLIVLGLIGMAVL